MLLITAGGELHFQSDETCSLGGEGLDGYKENTQVTMDDRAASQPLCAVSTWSILSLKLLTSSY